jgi:SPP1 family predicted phage head-tail adaptor
MITGRLNKRITLQKPVDTQDSVTGEMTTVWTTQKEVFASIEPVSAREFLQSGSDQGQSIERIKIRFDAELLITTAWRVLHGTTIYNINGVLPDKHTGREYITLSTSSGVNDG